MNAKTNKIIGWSLTGLLALLIGASAIFKLSGNETAVANFRAWGLNPSVLTELGAIELVITILFIIPRTAFIGTLFQIAYFGGAIATHLEHDKSAMMPAIIETLIWVSAFFRFPILKQYFFLGRTD